MDGSAMEVTFELTDDELQEGLRAYARAREGSRTLQITMVVLALLFVAVNQALTPGALGVWTLLAPLLGLTAWLWPRARAGVGVSSFRADVPWRRAGRLSIDAQAVRVDNGDSFTEVTYQGLRGWLETERAIVLSDRHGPVFVLPKRAFAPGDLPGLRQTLDTSVTRPPLTPAPEQTSRATKIVLFLFIASFFVAYAFWVRG